MTLLFKSIHDGQKFVVMNLMVDFNKGKLMKMKVDRMENIIFSKLWKCDACCKMINIYLQDKWSKRVCINQKVG